MYQTIHDSLFRQNKGLALLRDLLEEEYQILLSRDAGSAVGLEFSIHELIRQLAVEKSLVIRMVGGGRVMDYAAMLPEDKNAALRALFADIDEGEQGVSRQASRNAGLSLALLDQSTRALQTLTGMAVPDKAEVYGRRGGMARKTHTDAALISGRL
jgi:hypothetical protein